MLISLVKNFVAENLLQFLWAGENPLKNHYNLMHHFDVILLRNVISAFGPKVTRRVTYNFLEYPSYYKGNIISLNGA